MAVPNVLPVKDALNTDIANVYEARKTPDAIVLICVASLPAFKTLHPGRGGSNPGNGKVEKPRGSQHTAWPRVVPPV
jgi:hypothetical protein